MIVVLQVGLRPSEAAMLFWFDLRLVKRSVDEIKSALAVGVSDEFVVRRIQRSMGLL